MKPSDETDSQLIKKALSGDQAAYSQLVGRYKASLFSLTRRLSGSDDAALDLTQEAFVSAFQALGSFDPAKPFSPWLHRIAINKARDWARRRAVRRFFFGAASMDAAVPLASGEAGPDVAVADALALQRTMTLVDALPHNLREVLVLRAIEDRSQADTAALLGISEKAVETRLYRARAELRKKYEG